MKFSRLLIVASLIFVHCAHQVPVQSPGAVSIQDELGWSADKLASIPEDKVKDPQNNEKNASRPSQKTFAVGNRYTESRAKSLPTWRKAVGGASVAVGGILMILGILHLSFPLFSTPGGCDQYGLNHPCLLAGRFEAGIPLLIGGAIVGSVGGGFSFGFRY